MCNVRFEREMKKAYMDTFEDRAGEWRRRRGDEEEQTLNKVVKDEDSRV